MSGLEPVIIASLLSAGTAAVGARKQGQLAAQQRDQAKKRAIAQNQQRTRKSANELAQTRFAQARKSSIEDGASRSKGIASRAFTTASDILRED